ncbi:hypothetical protein Taro_020836 [Colocasia esculenta]|uniref:Uncharacterized protein n=1 Tax=Colocasia esculenta TaxID=4460 RepID=A0A843V3J2_COLES|nr:hypothetical protein [Colocasia esculenta]
MDSHMADEQVRLSLKLKCNSDKACRQPEDYLSTATIRQNLLGSGNMALSTARDMAVDRKDHKWRNTQVKLVVVAATASKMAPQPLPNNSSSKSSSKNKVRLSLKLKCNSDRACRQPEDFLSTTTIRQNLLGSGSMALSIARDMAVDRKLGLRRFGLCWGWKRPTGSLCGVLWAMASWCRAEGARIWGLCGRGRWACGAEVADHCAAGGRMWPAVLTAGGDLGHGVEAVGGAEAAGCAGSRWSLGNAGPVRDWSCEVARLKLLRWRSWCCCVGDPGSGNRSSQKICTKEWSLEIGLGI